MMELGSKPRFPALDAGNRIPRLTRATAYRVERGPPRTAYRVQDYTSVLSQQLTSVLSQQQTSVLAQQQTSVLSQQLMCSSLGSSWDGEN